MSEKLITKEWIFKEAEKHANNFENPQAKRGALFAVNYIKELFKTMEELEREGTN